VRRLVLVRHGESVWNAESRIQGQACMGLSARGHEQAQRTAEALAERHPGAHLVASDLERTRQTAAPIEQALGRTAVLDARLRERPFGLWEGRTREEARALDPERWDRWRGGEDVMAEIGGEPSADLTARAVAAFHALVETAEDGAVVVAVTHGGPIWFGLHALLGLETGRLGGVDNASITELVWHEPPTSLDPPVMERWNEVGHLPADLRTGWVVRRQPRPSGTLIGGAATGTA
jgi:2,3-bisphosphoglycerate-dependent phosphoglycerate mutase